MALVQKVSSALVAQVRNVRPGYVVIHPNRQKASCRLTRLIVVVLLIASVVLMLMLTIGGWNKLEGLKPVNFVWALLYVALAVAILLRWARWAASDRRRWWPSSCSSSPSSPRLGLAGTSWFDRNHHGFASPGLAVRRHRDSALTRSGRSRSCSSPWRSPSSCSR